MNIRRHLSSISVQYLLYCVGTLSVLLLVTFAVGYFQYLNLNKEKRHLYWDQSDIIANSIHDTFRYVENLFLVLGREIVQTQTYDIKDIGKILRRNTGINQLDSNHIAWTSYNEYDQHHHLVATNNEGELSAPIRIRRDQRKWIEDSLKSPWKLNVSEPAHGFISKRWIVPVALGITDSLDNHRGIISMGVQVSKMSKHIKVNLGESQSNYIVISADGNVIMSANQKDQENYAAYSTEEIKKILESLRNKDDAGWLEAPISIADINYDYYRKVYPYGYYIFMGSKSYISQYEYRQSILPKMVLTFAIGLVVLFYLQQTKMISPLIKLSAAADGIVKKEKNITFPRGASYEVNNLARALINVKRLLNKEKLLHQKLYKETEKANRANRAKSRFLANMSHELRTPLGAIIGFSELMIREKNGTLNKDQKEFVEIIHNSGKSLLQIINDILSLSSIEAGTVTIDEKLVSIEKILSIAIKAQTMDIQSKQLQIITSFAKNTPLLSADEPKIRRVLSNIISNAVKYSYDKGTIHIDLCLNKKNCIEVVIRDEGSGMDAETVETVTGEFYYLQGDTNSRRQHQGTGVGLSIVRNFLALHHASFTIDSQIGRGTTVHIIFPECRSNFSRTPVSVLAKA